MRHHILRGKAGKRGISCFAFFESKGHGLAHGQSRQGEIGADAVDFRLRQGQGAVAMLGKLGLDLGANNIGAFLMHQDLDARLVFVIAPPFEIIDAENGIGVGERSAFGKKSRILCATMECGRGRRRHRRQSPPRLPRS